MIVLKSITKLMYNARNIKIVNKLKQSPSESTGFSMKYDNIDDDIEMDNNINIFKKSTTTTTTTTKEEDIQMIRDTVLFKGDDPYYEKVVERPQKGRVWGMHGELVEQKQLFFDQHDELSMDKIITFLELNQIKDITNHDLEEYGKNMPQRYGIVGTMYSSQHGWKVCKELCKGFMSLYLAEQKQLEQQKLAMGHAAAAETNPEKRSELNIKRIAMGGVPYGKPQVGGAKDDEWLMVHYKEFMIHLFTEDSRNEVDVEGKWMYQPTEEEEESYERIQQGTKKHKKGFFEPL